MSTPFLQKPVLEKSIEAAGCNYAKSRGWCEFKTASPGRPGFPDRTYVRRGVVLFVEWKRPGGVLSKLQIVVHRELREHGANVHVIDNLEDAKALFK
jgi:hypothetical protein